MLLKSSQVFALQEHAATKLVDGNLPIRRVSYRENSSYSNENVTPETAITTSTVIAILTLLSQDTASLPLLLYARKGRNKFRASDSPYYRLMHDQPNPEMSSMMFREFIVGHIIAWGNFFGQMIWDETGVVNEIWPLRPDRMTVQRIDGQKIYAYRSASDNKPRTFMPDEILHIPGWGFDGLIGYSKIALARNAIGLAIATEKFGSKFFANDARPGIVLQHPTTLGDEAFKHLSESWNELHQGAENSHKPAILEEGMTIQEIGIPPEDAQFLQTRQFQVAEINRILGPVPPHMIGDIQKSTSWGTGIDSQEQGYVNHTLRPIAVRIEQALNSQLLLKSDRDQGYFYEHLFDGLLRGDIATRYEAYVKAITNGIMSRNEVREKENLNPRNGLDDMLQPLNMSTTGAPVEIPASGNAFRPLYRDAALRVVKREMNDLRGAVRRNLAKGQTAAFGEWSDQFYESDQPAFLQKQFAPIIEAQSRLLGLTDSADRLEIFFNGYNEGRRISLKNKTADQLEIQIDAWLETLPDLLTENIMQILDGVEYG